MSGEREELLREVAAFVDAYRGSCLWFLRRDYYPVSDEQIRRTLERIERNGDRRAFQEAARLRAWLSGISSEPSAA